MSVRLLNEHLLVVLRLGGGCIGSYVSTLAKMPHCSKSHVTAQFIFLACLSYCLIDCFLRTDLSTCSQRFYIGLHFFAHLSTILISLKFPQVI